MVWNLLHNPNLSPEYYHGRKHGVVDLFNQLYTPWQKKYNSGHHNNPYEDYGYGYFSPYTSDSEDEECDEDTIHFPQKEHQHSSNTGFSASQKDQVRIIPIQVIKSASVDTKAENSNHNYTSFDQFDGSSTKSTPQLNCDFDKITDPHDIRTEDNVIDLSEGDSEEECAQTDSANRDVIPLAQEPWVPSLKLTMQDKFDLLDGSMLSDKHIYAAQTLLQRQFPHISGFQDSCLSQVGFSCVLEPGIQIHHIDGNHWVISSSLDGYTKVYDSIYSSISQDLQRQLYDIYGTVRASNPPMQSQSGVSDCGLFVIAWAYELCTGNDIEGLRLSQDKLRSHLIRCFEEEQLSSFPEGSSFFRSLFF